MPYYTNHAQEQMARRRVTKEEVEHALANYFVSAPGRTDREENLWGLTAQEVARSGVVDESRVIDYGTDGKPVGIELLGASAGLKLSDLTYRYGLHEYTMSLLRLERAVVSDP